MEIKGTVQLKGKPIADGAMIQFFPQENQSTEGLVATKNGAFTLPKSNGLKPGKYKVTVSLGDGKTAVNPVEGGSPPGPGGGTNIISKELVPSDWNKKSKQTVTVTKEGPNKFDFDIP
ncbi:carboxypeptidase regulatory-like domain-containing protein [Telmatocola sphagniphila]|uniref:Carboxypeptidase regulatory-like domain-containing protein n=1 Tax=Telmatocola sphagniphila TaxID=1123043 RepID=A0A8E6B6H9_9BACT|nr:carboxypeptidase-like regulatory domain-containing protein [Telmatocola sphagniphila]QVL31310.1 carboxypeptidase regulatory-like domain-containing protein [Telmatocola sphagniphila]